MPVIIGPFKLHEATSLARMYERVPDHPGVVVSVNTSSKSKLENKRVMTLTYSRGMKIGTMHVTAKTAASIIEQMNLRPVSFPFTFIPEYWTEGGDIFVLHTFVDNDLYARKVHMRLLSHKCAEIDVNLLLS